MDSKIGTLLTNNVGQRSKALGDQLVATSHNLRAIGDQLRSDTLTHGAAVLADVSANKIEEVGQYLSTSDVESLVSDAEAFTRDNPWSVVIGGLALGLTTSRVIKAGAARRGLRTAAIETSSPATTGLNGNTAPAPAKKKLESNKIGGARARG